MSVKNLVDGKVPAIYKTDGPENTLLNSMLVQGVVTISAEPPQMI